MFVEVLFSSDFSCLCGFTNCEDEKEKQEWEMVHGVGCSKDQPRTKCNNMYENVARKFFVCMLTKNNNQIILCLDSWKSKGEIQLNLSTQGNEHKKVLTWGLLSAYCLRYIHDRVGGEKDFKKKTHFVPFSCCLPSLNQQSVNTWHTVLRQQHATKASCDAGM